MVTELKTTHYHNDSDPLESVSRVPRSKEDARTFYNRFSRWYDLLAEGSERRLRGVGLQLLAAQPGEIVAELGFGTGRAVVALAERVGPSGHVFGLDISPEMLMRAQSKVNRVGCTGQVTLECGDAARLPYDNQQLDAVFMSFTLELFDTPDIPAVLAECRRVLKPGGRLVLVSMYAAQGTPSVMERLYLWGHSRFPRFVDCRPLPVGLILLAEHWTAVQKQTLNTFGLPVMVVRATPPSS